jgi:hypothetical protein
LGCWRRSPVGVLQYPKGKVSAAKNLADFGQYADRAAARAAGADAPKRRQPAEVGWWRDATQIVYEQPPNMTLRMVEGRLMRAVACCGAANFHQARLTTPIWEEIGLAAAAELARIENESSPDIVPKFVPLPADLFKQAKEDCWRMANGMQPSKGLAKRVDHMAVVREANKRAKARSG